MRGTNVEVKGKEKGTVLISALELCSFLFIVCFVWIA